MPTFGKKKSHMDWLYTRPMLAILSILILLVGYAVFSRLMIERDMYARRLAAEQELQEATERQVALTEKVEHLEGERGIEEEIRKHFDVAREGETVVILTGDEAVSTTSTRTPTTSAPRWYEFWR